MKNNRSFRGQIWTIDFITGLVALSFILMLYLIMWNTIAVRWNWASKQTSMEASAYFASESLLATPGEPEGWEMFDHINENISAIGLVSGRNELNRMKLEKFVSENATAYNDIKARLGLQRYEFGMKILDISENTKYYEFGKFSSLNNSLTFRRFAILDGQPVIVQMEVWGG